MTSKLRHIFPEISETPARSHVPYLCSHSFPWLPLPQMLQKYSMKVAQQEGQVYKLKPKA